MLLMRVLQALLGLMLQLKLALAKVEHLAKPQLFSAMHSRILQELSFYSKVHDL